ncbi:MAG: hypothetical protein ACM4D3_16385 [Candidatus Sericytochromatia bacterium]
MAEWLLLLLLVPAIVVPVVFLFGCAGCEFEHGRLGPPYIESASGKSESIITLRWAGAGDATKIEFERTKLGAMDQPVESPHPFEKTPSETTFDDPGLAAATKYRYTVRAVYSDGETSAWSEPVNGTTLALPTPTTHPTFDVSGTGATDSGFNGATATWTHTASGNSRAVLLGLRWAHTGPLINPQAPVRTATYGGATMQSLGVFGLNNVSLTAVNGVYHEFFRLLNPPAGPQAVSIAVSRSGASINISGNSVSYVEVSVFGPVSSVAGSEAGTSLPPQPQTVSSATNETVVQMFNTASGAITGYNQTLRVDDGANGFVIGDAPGAATVTFTANRAAGVDYAGLAVRLMPV